MKLTSKEVQQVSATLWLEEKSQILSHCSKEFPHNDSCAGRLLRNSILVVRVWLEFGVIFKQSPKSMWPTALSDSWLLKCNHWNAGREWKNNMVESWTKFLNLLLKPPVPVWMTGRVKTGESRCKMLFKCFPKVSGACHQKHSSVGMFWIYPQMLNYRGFWEMKSSPGVMGNLKGCTKKEVWKW